MLYYQRDRGIIPYPVGSPRISTAAKNPEEAPGIYGGWTHVNVEVVEGSDALSVVSAAGPAPSLPLGNVIERAEGARVDHHLGEVTVLFRAC